MVITEPAVASSQLLGLGLKLYPSNMPRMLNKHLTRFMQSESFSSTPKSSERNEDSVSRVGFYIPDSIKVALGMGNWALGIGKLLFGGHSSKLLHCLIRTNAQCPITNDQSNLF